MCELPVEGLADLDALSPGELRELLHELERRSRQLEASIVAVVGHAARSAAYAGDGHASAAGWCRAKAQWSAGDARQRLRLARLCQAAPVVAEAMAGGRLGIAQADRLARAFANPRCGELLLEMIDLLLEQAQRLSCDGFRTVVDRWETLADMDGAHRHADEVEARRNASIRTEGGELRVKARGPVLVGAMFKEVFDQYLRAEFLVDWEETRRIHGDAACTALMPRTDSQRRFDAFAKIFERAATTRPDGTSGPGVLVNLVADVGTVEALLNGASELPTPADPRQRRCETADGAVIPPAELLPALWWGQVRRVIMDTAGVVIDMGRRSRLFAGNARDAALLGADECVWPGCLLPPWDCDADHNTAWEHLGVTDQANAGPMCGRHNRHKTRGDAVFRDAAGYWHTLRPDGTEVGWPVPGPAPPTPPRPP